MLVLLLCFIYTNAASDEKPAQWVVKKDFVALETTMNE